MLGKNEKPLPRVYGSRSTIKGVKNDKIKYFPEHDVLDVWTGESAETAGDLVEDITIDYNKKGEVVGPNNK